ncbi:3667_t:CDS:1, partial [Funneliformis mosseae]
DNLKISTPLKSISSAVGLSVLSSISILNSFPLETEQNFDKEEEYMPLLTSRQHFVKLDIEKDKKEDTRNICKGRRKLVKTIQLLLTPNFKHSVHPKLLHWVFINLPPNYEVNFSKLINLFLLFFQTPY